MSHPMTIDLPHLQSWVGRTESVEDVVTPRLVAGFDATLGPNLAPVGAGEAPLALHWCLAPPAVPMAELGPDGHPARGGFLPPVPLPRRMWAGGEIETHAPLRVGDVVMRRSRIESVEAKQGRSGALVFVAVRHDYATGRGVAVSERHDIVYRDVGPAAPEAKDPGGATERRTADLDWRVEADPVLLFRYSALTFNGHRIHYDHPYVTGVEGYPGLVVHGPIQASLMFNLAAVLGGRAPARFSYRGLSPLIAGGVFSVRGARAADGSIACWVEAADGRITMEGRCR
jgi:3-methylfumaryl-CoA hydratase